MLGTPYGKFKVKLTDEERSWVAMALDGFVSDVAEILEWDDVMDDVVALHAKFLTPSDVPA